MIRAVIVDDEPLAREGLRLRLAREPDIELVAEAADGNHAVRAIRELRPDLVFLDVQMPGLDGFDVLERIAEVHLPEVVFVTAHDQHALRAFDVYALDYLLKPYTEERFAATLERARTELARHAERVHPGRIGALLEERAADGHSGPRKWLERLSVRTRNHYVLLRVHEVRWFEASANYIEVFARDRSWLLRGTMRDLERRLDPERFARIHRSTIVNLERVRELKPDEHGDFLVTLDDGTALRMSRTYRDRVLPRERRERNASA
jgi:two-component system, LytTR family, response regulator